MTELRWAELDGPLDEYNRAHATGASPDACAQLGAALAARAPLCAAPGAPAVASRPREVLCAATGPSPALRALALRFARFSPSPDDYDALVSAASAAIEALEQLVRDRWFCGPGRLRERLAQHVARSVGPAHPCALAAWDSLVRELESPRASIPSVLGPGESAELLVVADIHGSDRALDRAIAEGAARARGGPPLLLTLGDYVDNNAGVPRVLDTLVSLRWAAGSRGLRGDRLPAHILGNHDLACLCALRDHWRGSPGTGQQWWESWHHYWNSVSVGAPAAYGASTLAEFREAFPEVHRLWLASLPWALRAGSCLAVHHGLPIAGQCYGEYTTPAPALDEQLEQLAMRDLSAMGSATDQPIYLRAKTLPRVSDASWPFVVLSGHCKLRGGADHVGVNRLTLHSGACMGEPLHCALLQSDVAPGSAPSPLLFQAAP
eukprot:m51a1_g625 hypothetical protein (435) ;mRNA; f:132674-134152